MARDDILAARLKNLTITIFVLFIIIVARLVELQVIKHDHYARLAEGQHVYKETLRADRGTIFDRNGVPLAVSRDIYSFFAEPPKINNPVETSRAISKVLDIPVSRLERKFRSHNHFEWIARRVPLDRKRLICDMGLSGIGFRLEKGRNYPRGSLLAQILGFCGVDNIGRWGLEQELEQYLRGTDGWVYMVRDACGKRYVDLSLPKKSPVRGCDIVLTIDSRLQEIVEMVLDRTVQEMRAKSGTVVVVDPGSGDVLAMANYPTIDLYELWPPLDKSVYNRLKNRATMDTFEPGSTFKLITMASLIENGKVRPDELVYCENGTYQVGRRRIEDSHPQQWLTVKDVFSKSSNIGMSKLIDRLTEVNLLKTIKDFGIGSPSGIKFVSEEKGILHQPGDPGWSNYTMQSMSYGQEVSVTALQMTMAYSAVANGGELLLPQMVKEIQGHGREPIWKSERKVLWESVSRQSTLILKDFLCEVVLRGTGTSAQVGSIPVAGKTGTAEKAVSGQGYVHGKYVSSFGGFFPVDNPGVVVYIAIDEPQEKYYGGEVAAPAFRKIIEFMMMSCPDIIDIRSLAGMEGTNRVVRVDNQTSHLSARIPEHDYGTTLFILPAVSGESLIPDPKQEAVIVPDLLGMSVRDAVKVMKNYNLNPQISGSGFVVKQNPPAGSILSRGQNCYLRSSFSGGAWIESR